MTNQGILFYGVVAVLAVILAEYVPWLVNGILFLILLALLLRNSPAISGAVSQGLAATQGKVSF